VNGVLALHQALQGTLLGDYVLLQTAVPQIAGCESARKRLGSYKRSAGDRGRCNDCLFRKG
jgi:hypothetical protein